jgi:hypothetical protein
VKLFSGDSIRKASCTYNANGVLLEVLLHKATSSLREGSGEHEVGVVAISVDVCKPLVEARKTS